MMEGEEGNGGATPPLEPRRHELLAASVLLIVLAKNPENYALGSKHHIVCNDRD